MIHLALIKDELVDGQRRAAGKKIRHCSVLAVDRYNVVLANSIGSAPMQGKFFLANFQHLLNEMSSEDIEVVTPQLQEYFGNLYKCDLSNLTIEEMNSKLNLSQRNKTGAMELYLAIKSQGKIQDDDEDEGDNEEKE